MSKPFVVAIDPGTEKSGLVVWDVADEKVVGADVLPNSDVLLLLQNDIFRGTLENADVAIEMIASYGMPVGKEVFETCVFIGRLLEAYKAYADPRLVYRREVKLHLCQSPRAKDANIWQALVDRFGPPGTKKAPGRLYGVTSHARAALALAVTVADARSAEP